MSAPPAPASAVPARAAAGWWLRPLNSRSDRIHAWLAATMHRADGQRTPRARVLGVFDTLCGWYAEEGFRGCAIVNAATDTRGDRGSTPAIARRHLARYQQLFETQLTAAAAWHANYSFCSKAPPPWPPSKQILMPADTRAAPPKHSLPPTTSAAAVARPIFAVAPVVRRYLVVSPGPAALKGYCAMPDLPTKSFTARLRFATIKTTDLDRSLGFYEQVLGFPRTKTAEDFVQLDAGGAELCVDLDDGGEHQPRLIFAVDDIEALCAHLQHTGVEIIAGGPDKPWVMVRDADGNEVVFET